jgi:hypothetical protein
MLRLLTFFLLLSIATCCSIHYVGSDESGARIVNANLNLIGSVKAKILSTLHVADLFARLNGIAPMLSEEQVDLPSLDILGAKPQRRAVLLEIFGSKDALPASYQRIVSVQQDSVSDSVLPNVEEVGTLLLKSGVDVEYHSIESSDMTRIENWVRTMRGANPAVVLHSEISLSRATMETRRLYSKANVESEYEEGKSQGRGDDVLSVNADEDSSSVSGPSDFQIQEYQINLWVTVMFVGILLAAIAALFNMEVIPDSMLFAKFQSVRTNKNE